MIIFHRQFNNEVQHLGEQIILLIFSEMNIINGNMEVWGYR